MDTRATRHFSQASHPQKRTPFAVAYDDLLRDVKFLTNDLDDYHNVLALNDREEALQASFKNFLHKLEMPLALKNFDALLLEKKNNKFVRNDGSINWFHEFIPLVMVMNLFRLGPKNGGADLRDLDQYGGLECLIVSHLRHDSVEDFTSNDAMIEEQFKFINEIRAINPSYNVGKARETANQSIVNIDLMTQKKEEQADGSFEKEDVVLYTYRMVSSEDANPIVFMLKQADVIHNFATLFGAEKFSPERRLKRCNEREDMYGPRYDFTDAAKEKWKPFRRAINSLDGMMGIMLYPHFRYLQDVDLHYKRPYGIPVGMPRYMHGALNFKLPEIINPLHIFMKRLAKSVDHTVEPEKYERLQGFMDKVIIPNLEKYPERFQYLFRKDAHKPASSFKPVAMP